MPAKVVGQESWHGDEDGDDDDGGAEVAWLYAVPSSVTLDVGTPSSKDA